MVNLIKKAALSLLILLAVAYGYRYLTGRSITTLPGEIVAALQQKSPPAGSQNPKYYTDPVKRMQDE